MQFGRLLPSVSVLVLLAFASGCLLDAPFDPANVLGRAESLVAGAADRIDDIVEDPFDARPYPALIGGDDRRLFYTTNLTDIRVRFPGPTNELVLPGLLGPSNVYALQNGQRELLRALVPGTQIFGLDTDGQAIVYAEIVVGEDTSFSRVFHDDGLTTREVFATEGIVLPRGLRLENGRVVVAVVSDASRLYLVDLLKADAPPERIADASRLFAVSGDRLAYVTEDENFASTIHLRDLATGRERIVAEGIRTWTTIGVRPLFAGDLLVWGETVADGVVRVRAYDPATDTIEVWAEAVAGELAGATERFFVTQERRVRERSDKIVITRHEMDTGRSRQVADFRADGRAGQARVIGNRIVFVNDERRIVTVPLDGGERRSFGP